MEDGWIKKQWVKYQPEIIGGIILTTVLSIATGIWAMAQTWAGPLIIPLVLGVFALGLVTTNQIYIIRERNKKGLANQSNEQVEATIRNWLVNDPGYKFQMKDINDPLFHNDRLFHFEVEDERGRNISIARPRAKLTRLDLASAIYLAPDHKKQYEALSASERKTLVHNLRVEMARLGVVFKGLEGIEPKLERIDFGDSVSLDNLTEFYLKQRILFMIRVGFLLNELIIRGLGL